MKVTFRVASPVVYEWNQITISPVRVRVEDCQYFSGSQVRVRLGKLTSESNPIVVKRNEKYEII